MIILPVNRLWEITLSSSNIYKGCRHFKGYASSLLPSTLLSSFSYSGLCMCTQPKWPGRSSQGSPKLSWYVAEFSVVQTVPSWVCNQRYECKNKNSATFREFFDRFVYVMCHHNTIIRGLLQFTCLEHGYSYHRINYTCLHCFFGGKTPPKKTQPHWLYLSQKPKLNPEVTAWGPQSISDSLPYWIRWLFFFFFACTSCWLTV